MTSRGDQVNETSPLIGTGEDNADVTGASGLMYTSSAPAHFVVSPGSRAHVQAIEQRSREVRIAAGTGRTVRPIRRGENRSRIIPTAKNEEDHKNDPLREVRNVPYQKLMEENPGAEITRRAMSRNDLAHGDNYRERYYERLRDMARTTLTSMDESHLNLENPNLSREDPDGGEVDNETDPLLRGGERQSYHVALDFLARPDHLIPADFYRLHCPLESHDETSSSDGKQSSLVTILSLWNTMMGTSLLAMPWALVQAGFIGALLLPVLVGGIGLYTALMILDMHKSKESKLKIKIHEFSHLASILIPRRYGASMVITACSVIAVFGACTVYWMLMTNFTYNSVKVAADAIRHRSFPTSNMSLVCAKTAMNNEGLANVTDFFIPGPGGLPQNDTMSTLVDLGLEEDAFDKFWTPHIVAVLLIIPIGAIVSFDSISFFSKFNCIGTVNVMFLLGFVTYFSASWGANVDFVDPLADEYVPMFRLNTFFCLTGTLALGLFIHNAIITIMKNNRDEKKNTRDASIGFSLVLATYMLIGFGFYIPFPLKKDCIADNFLNNFEQNSSLIIFARVLMDIQLFCVFPLVMFILRSQVVQIFIRNPDAPDPRCMTIMVNITCMIMFVLETVFIPTISTVIRFAGAGCGMILIFVGPIVCQIFYFHEEQGLKQNWGKVLVGVVIMILGVGNFVLQFTKV